MVLTAAKQFAHLLPKVRKGAVAADSEYFDDSLGLQLWKTGRALFAQSKQYPDNVPKKKTY